MKPEQEHLDKIRHSTSHLLAAAVLELYPDAKPTLGPSIENGFYYDFDFGNQQISEEDLEKIEKVMGKLLPSWTNFSHREVEPSEAKKIFQNNEYKIELIEEHSGAGEKISLYKSGEFEDLCRGGHSENPSKEIGAFKLLSVAGAYWRGDEKNKMLTRIYGIAFQSKEELDHYLYVLEETKKRDHRKIGKDLKIFTFAEEIGPGLPLWLPRGTIIKEELEKWGKETEDKWGYKRVSTPFITKRSLFEISGHVPYFEEEMYKVSVPDEGKEEYFIKPMNCPFHHMIYKSDSRSYRELPLRLAEYGTVARYEQAGSLNGILRPRIFVQNDAHVYCTEEQAVDVFVEIINLHRYYYDKLGLKDYYIVLALRDPEKKDKYHGEEEMWQKAEKLSLQAMEKAGIEYKVENEGAAHYGPKMDFKIRSAIGTEYGISTNQIDLFMPKRFDLKYTDEHGQEKFVIVQHRAPLGSSERFVGFLLEHFVGALPLWLSPDQVKIIPVSDKFNGYAKQVENSLRGQLEANNISGRVEIDDRAERLQSRIRDAELMKVPYILVVGGKEEESSSVAVRVRHEGDKGSVGVEEFGNRLVEEIRERKLELWK